MTNINRREFGLGLLGTAGAVAFGRLPLQPQLRVNDSRLIEHLNALAEGSNVKSRIHGHTLSDGEHHRADDQFAKALGVNPDRVFAAW